jgi:ribosome-binding factor A
VYRREKLESLLGQELGKLIARHKESGALITITGVELSRKEESLRVFVSILPEAQEDEALGELQRRASEFRHMLLKKLSLRAIPYLQFTLDAGSKNAAAVEKALLQGEAS